jgi:hypothetical protein
MVIDALVAALALHTNTKSVYPEGIDEKVTVEVVLARVVV